ncbi:TylF/MycF/NovP-related O-methyltransferase [Desulfosporosinus fructosivorans]
MNKLLLFGTGCKSLDFKSILDNQKAEIIAYIDNDPSLHGQHICDKKIISPSEICNYIYDYIVIVSRKYSDISAQLENLGIDSEKIIGPYLDCNEILHKHSMVVNKLVTKSVDLVSTNMQKLDRERLISIPANEDYVRISSLEKLSQEIYENYVLGNVAELGVYRGDFAKYINQLFHDRKLYLFDTFEGFNKADIKVEQQMKFSNSETNDFQNTSIDIVVSKMKYPEMCRIMQGYFPDTAISLEDQFAYVSIDADLYSPTYAGLQYFYPRMAKHGYIFVHDYGNSRFKGAKVAVKQYCSENNINYFPLTDICGTAVIMK